MQLVGRPLPENQVLHQALELLRTRGRVREVRREAAEVLDMWEAAPVAASSNSAAAAAAADTSAAPGLGLPLPPPPHPAALPGQRWARGRR